MKPDGRLLIVEMVLPEDDTPHPGKMLDMMMLVGPGGQERTPSEYEQILRPGGIRPRESRAYSVGGQRRRVRAEVARFGALAPHANNDKGERPTYPLKKDPLATR